MTGYEEGNPNSGHGHVFKRPDGMLARCGGPAVCQVCAGDAARKAGLVGPAHQPGTPEYEIAEGYRARAVLATMQGTLIREHSGGHRLMGEFCPICQQSPKT